jgi:hypothetical protein
MNKLKIVLVFALFSTIGFSVYLNLKEKAAIDESRLPTKVAEDRAFLRWITNLKNKEIEIDADEFSLIEEREAYNAGIMRVYSLEEEGKKEFLEDTLAKHKDLSHIAFSPSETLFLDYRDVIQEKAQKIRLFGLKENKIIDIDIIECSVEKNCYFDRAYFLTNDYFVIHEISLANKEDPCSRSEICTHTIKTHLVDLINNKIRTYTSKEKQLNLQEWITKNSPKAM